MLTASFAHPRRATLLLGDILTFLAFAALGRRAHSMGSALDDVIGTALPFMLAWALVAPFTGAYGERAMESPAHAARTSLLTWGIAFPLGLLVRVPIVGRLPHVSFAVVAGAFTLLLLTGWRSVFAGAAGRR